MGVKVHSLYWSLQDSKEKENVLQRCDENLFFPKISVQKKRMVCTLYLHMYIRCNIIIFIYIITWDRNRSLHLRENWFAFLHTISPFSLSLFLTLHTYCTHISMSDEIILKYIYIMIEHACIHYTAFSIKRVSFL